MIESSQKPHLLGVTKAIISKKVCRSTLIDQTQKNNKLSHNMKGFPKIQTINQLFVWHLTIL